MSARGRSACPHFFRGSATRLIGVAAGDYAALSEGERWPLFSDRYPSEQYPSRHFVARPPVR
jgi:hypothetical protein